MSPEPFSPSSGTVPPDDACLVDDQEELMRRVIKRLQSFNREKSPQVQAGAFLPRQNDTDGLSLNRRFSTQYPLFLTPEGSKNWHEVPESIRSTCGVVSVLAEAARSLGLTVTPAPASSPGHVVIEELNWHHFAGELMTEDSRKRVSEWAFQLARLATVLIEPGKAPAK